MSHARRVEQPHALVHRLLTDGLDHPVVVHQRRARRDVRIRPPLVDQQLAPAREERREVRIVRAERRVVERVHAVVVLREIERLRIPVRILEQDVLEDVVAHVERKLAAGDRRPLQLAARLEAGEDQLTGLRVRCAGVQPADRLHLRRRQARIGIRACLALDDLRIEAAAEDVFDEPVLQPVERVARLQRRAVNRGVRRRRDDALRRLVRRLPLRHEAERFVAPVVRGRAGENRVEVGGVALRLLERHSAAARAAGEVRQLGRHPVEAGDGRLAVHGGLVNGAMPEVGDLLGVPERPRRAGARVPGVGGRGRIAAAQRLTERGVLDRSGEGAVAHLLELAVPSRDGHPDFAPDVGVGRGLDGELDAAERREAGNRPRRLRARRGRRERAGRHEPRGGDRRIGQFQCCRDMIAVQADPKVRLYGTQGRRILCGRERWNERGGHSDQQDSRGHFAPVP